MLTKEPTSCRRSCGARGIVPVLVVERFGSSTRTSFHCPVCGEVLAVAWEKKRKDSKPQK